MENRGNEEMRNLSLQIGKYPRDLLQRFKPSTETQASSRSNGDDEEEEEEELELNLGLSLGGRFGVDKKIANKLTRSSSIAGSIPIFREDDHVSSTNYTPRRRPAAYNYNPTTLVRSSSLPVETEEEWRKRKELQSLRRMEAKRRRSEKQRSSREKTEEVDQNKQVGPPFGYRNWAAAARQVILGGRKGGGGSGGGGAQGSVESQRGSSSCMSEMENKALQGT